MACRYVRRSFPATAIFPRPDRSNTADDSLAARYSAPDSSVASGDSRYHPFTARCYSFRAMRIAHCTVALVVFALLTGVGHAQPPAPVQPVDFTVFFKGVAIGVEQVTVARTPLGFTITGTERIGPPLSMTVRKAEITYSPEWYPLECVIEGSLRDQQIMLHTTVTGTTATSGITQGTAVGHKADEIAPDAVLLPNLFFGAYEALAARLATAKPGDELKAYVPPQAQVAIRVKSIADDRVRTQAALLQIRRFTLEFANPNRPADFELWEDSGGRLLRLSVPAQALDVVRSDIASVSSRREPHSRTNDETYPLA